MMSRWPRRAGWVVTLMLFWLLFSQSFDPQSLITGLAIAGALTLINDDLLLSLQHELHVTPRSLGVWVSFWVSLVFEIVKAGWQVAILAFSPRLNIEPHFVLYEPQVKEPMMRVSLANSITLTPGTLSVEAPPEGAFVIHVLTPEAAEGLKDWHIEKRLSSIERMR